MRAKRAPPRGGCDNRWADTAARRKASALVYTMKHLRRYGINLSDVAKASKLKDKLSSRTPWRGLLTTG